MMGRKLSLVNADCFQAVYLDDELIASDLMRISVRQLIEALKNNKVGLDDLETFSIVLADKNPGEAPQKLEDV